MVKFIIFKRTFKARLFPKGSRQRRRLNSDSRTSEFFPSNKFGVKSLEKASSGRPLISTSFTTKKKAMDFIRTANASRFLSTSERRK